MDDLDHIWMYLCLCVSPLSYVEKYDLEEPSDDIQYVLKRIAVKLRKTQRVKAITGVGKKIIQQTASFFVMFLLQISFLFACPSKKAIIKGLLISNLLLGSLELPNLFMLTGYYSHYIELQFRDFMVHWSDVSHYSAAVLSAPKPCFKWMKMLIFLSSSGNITVIIPNYTAAAYDFIRTFRKGELGQVMLDWAGTFIRA